MLLVSGSKISADDSAVPSVVAPPTISTVSSKSRAEACQARGPAIVAANAEVPAAGSKISTSALGAPPTRPPVTSTRPSASNVADGVHARCEQLPGHVVALATGS